MALHDDEMNKRRERREEMRRRQAQEQKRLKIALVFAAVVLIACGAGLFFIARNAALQAPQSAAQSATVQEGQQSATEQTQEAATKPTQQSRTQQTSATTTIHIKAAGDLNITDGVISAGFSANGFDYTSAFLDVSHILSDADLTVMNFEGNICGEPYGTATTSAPPEILEGLKKAGVDLLQTANSCSVNNGLNGLNATLQAIRNAGLEPMGTYSNSSEFRKSKGYTICDVQGVKVAFVAFTKGLGGRGLPEGSEDCVNLLYNDYSTTYNEVDKEGIRAVLKNVAAENPDITIAMLHWGSEFNEVISDSQRNIASLLKKEGVDVIIGTHPHLVQEIDYDPLAGTLVAYSLGDFFGEANRGGTNYSIILDMEITKDPSAGTTKVTGFSYTPIYTMTSDDCNSKQENRRWVVRINEAIVAYNGNYVDSITKTCYENMTYALQRISERTDPPETEDK